MPTYKELIEKLGLSKHPEGGYFKEIYRCSKQISSRDLESNLDGKRSAATSIYFLLPSGEVSKLHRLKSDELWYFHAGSSLTIFMINREGELRQFKLGLNIEQGEEPQLIIPAGSIFGAAVNAPDSYTLVGCMVAPGFDFQDFELLPRQKLMAEFPQYKAFIEKLT